MPTNLWVYKCNRDERKWPAFGDWEDVFSESKTRQWGGSWCTGNNVSKNIINERMEAGDLILAYQTNDRLAVGVCRLVKITGERNERLLWMKPLQRFDPPFPIHEMKPADPSLYSVRAFNGNIPQTVYEVSQRERKTLERAFAVNLSVDPDEPVLPPKSSGGCFGNPESNRRVERAAIECVRRKYQRDGWTVKSVESERCGYDLKCRRGDEVEYVEVKGRSGPDPCFIITRNEKDQAESNPAFVIWIVTSANSKSPTLNRLTGEMLCAEYAFDPRQFLASPKRSASPTKGSARGRRT